jgi:hypothetical protein
MNQLAGSGSLIAPDQPSGRSVKSVEAVQLVALEDCVASRAGASAYSGESVRAQFAFTSKPHDLCLSFGCQSARGAMRTAAAVLETGKSLIAVAVPPLVNGCPGDAELLGNDCR